MRPVAEKETKDSLPGPPPGEGVVRSPSPEEQSPPSLGRPSQGRLLLRLPSGLAGAWTGGAAALRPALRRCIAGGCCAGALYDFVNHLILVDHLILMFMLNMLK